MTTQLLSKFSDLIARLEAIRRDIVCTCEIDYESQDARMVALDSLQEAIDSVRMWFTAGSSLRNVHMKDGGRLDECSYLKSLGSNRNIDHTEDCMVKILRLGLIVLVHFSIENLFKNILKHINKLPAKQNYSNLTEAIMRVCDLKESGTERECLKAFSYIRNSLHNNGIHQATDLSLKLDGHDFIFKKGERVECASFDHIIVLLNSNVEVLRKILLSPKLILVTKGEIKDDFASGV